MKQLDARESAIDRTLEAFARTTDEIFSLEELKQRLSSGKQLLMKYGVDVTAPDLHIGHAVNLWMYRELQELGHKLVFLIGDFTTQIGDPTGKNKLRPIIPLSEIQRNAEEFIRQAKMVVHDDPRVMEIRRNSEWLEPMSSKQLLSLMSMVTHDRLMTRDMFRRRAEEGKEIYEHELIYPILQGYDSVMLEADLTVVGTDQLYNEMMGRFYQERLGKKPQVVLTTKITPGIDGGEKQSKSVGNYIGLNHSPREKFGRVMSIPDTLIVQYFQVYTTVPLDRIAQIESDLSEDPMKHKMLLAKEIVSRYHGEDCASEEQEWFRRTFSERQTPDAIPVVSVGTPRVNALELLRVSLTDSPKSNSELRRLIQQRGVRIDGHVIESPEEELSIPCEGLELRVGKRRWFRVHQ